MTLNTTDALNFLIAVNLICLILLCIPRLIASIHDHNRYETYLMIVLFIMLTVMTIYFYNWNYSRPDYTQLLS